MSAKVVDTITMRVGEVKPYGFDLTKFCANYFSPGEIYGLGEVVRPREIVDGGRGPTGLEYVLTQAGQCRDIEPVWPTTVGATVTSGTCVFTAQAISNASLIKTITNSTWSSVDEVTTDDDATTTTNGEQKTQTFFTAVEVTQSPIEIVNTITFSDGQAEKLAFKVKVIASA